MATYRLKPGAGKHRMKVKNGRKAEYRLLKPGDAVELTDAQFGACSDKFEKGDALASGPSSAELRAMADAKEKEEKAAADKAKAEALAKAKDAEAAALAARDAEAKAGKGAPAPKG